VKKPKVAKRKVGRPPRYSEPRISIAARLQAGLYEQIKCDAEATGRSISEEIERRLNLSFEWQRAEGDVRKWLADSDAAIKNGFKSALRQAGYQPIHDINGTFWAEPGMEIGKFTGVINPAIEDAIERIVERAMLKVNKQ
jgi:hypothetical protein